MKRVQVWLSAGALSLGIVASLVTGGWAQGAVDTEAESKLVKSVIDDTLEASNARNIDLMLTQYSDDAKIDSKAAGAKISKSAYKDVLTRAWARNPDGWAEYGKLSVSVVDPTHAVAEGVIYIHLHSASGQKTRHVQGGPDVTEPHEWKMEKRDGRWLIVETTYR